MPKEELSIEATFIDAWHGFDGLRVREYNRAVNVELTGLRCVVEAYCDRYGIAFGWDEQFDWADALAALSQEIVIRQRAKQMVEKMTVGIVDVYIKSCADSFREPKAEEMVRMFCEAWLPLIRGEEP